MQQGRGEPEVRRPCPEERAAQGWPERLLAWRTYLLAAALLLAVLAWWCIPRLHFDRSIEKMFPPASPVLAAYQRLQRTFGGNEIVLAVYDDPELFARDGSGVRRVTTIRQQLAAVPGVKAVLSIDQPLPGAMVVSDAPLAQRTRTLFTGYTHGDDERTVSIVCMLYPPAETTVPRQATIDQMRALMQALPAPLSPGYLTGEPALVVDGFRYVERDGRQLGIWSTLLLGLTIILCFRSLRWVVIPVLVVQWTLIMTQAILVLARMELSMVSSMLTAVVMVIGVATMVHVMVRFGDGCASGLSPAESLVQTMRDLAWPIFWSCLTDAVGFLALTVSDVGPVQDFGVMMAVGALMVLVSVMVLVPGLTIWGRHDLYPQRPWGDGFLSRQLQQLLSSVQLRPWGWLLGSATATLMTMSGILLLRVETDFTRNFRQDSEIAISYRYVEEHLGGAGVCDLVIPAPEQLDADFLARVLELENQIRAESQREGGAFAAITKVFSLADAVDQLSPVELANQPRLVRNSLALSGLTAMRGWMPEFFGAMYGRDPQNGRYYWRIMLRVDERQEAEQKRQLIMSLDQAARAAFPDAEVTGYFVLLSHLIDSVLRDQWWTFLAAFAGIALLMTLAFGDWRLTLIAMVPNTFPVLVVLGGMGWLSRLWLPELRINMGTAMIAAVSMGLSIDSSIHYILSFQRALRSGATVDESLRGVQRQVGKAMVFSTLALAVGFTVLATSRFLPTVYFGALVTLAMLGGLIGNLVGLPLLLFLTMSRTRTETMPNASAV